MYFAVAIDLLGLSLVEPFIPLLALQYEVGSLEIGFIFASYPLWTSNLWQIIVEWQILITL